MSIDGGVTSVTRWRRYGKDRLYVMVGEDVKVGYWDLVSGEGHPESTEHEVALTAAVEAWKAEQGTGEPVAPVNPPEPIQAAPIGPVAALAAVVPEEEPVVAAPVPPAVVVAEPEPAALPAVFSPMVAEREQTPDRPWIDLTSNRAGAEAREQALAAREAAPVKTFLARALGVHTDERAWRIGADGEEKVAAQLAKAAKRDPRWLFLHAIPVGNRGSDIDHLIVGPGGVFTVNAKHHPKAKIWVGGNTFMVNGSKQPYVRNSRHEATRAAKLLTDACGFLVHVEGLIVTVNAEDVVVKSQPDGVSVVPRMQVAKWLLRHGDILDGSTIETIHDVARRSTTWRP